MKGTATLILTDAATGEVVSSVVEHNLVTDALNNIFNPCPYAMLHRFDGSALFGAALPMWKELLSGVMLLGNSVTENKNSIFLGSDTVPIATAGSPYSGTNIYRGTLNENESGELPNGYRFTWDFGTDKANGTIRCVALTSKMFGDAGFHSDGETDGSFMMDPCHIGTTGIDPTVWFEYGCGQYLGTFESGVHLYAELDGDGALVFRSYRSIDPSALMINDSVGLSAVSEPVSERRVTLPFAVKYDDRYFLDTDTMVMYYFGEAVMHSDTGTMDITYTGISLDSFSVVETKTLTIPKYCGNYYIGAVWKGHVYFLTPDGLSEFTADGTLVKDHAAPYGQGTLLFLHEGCLMSQSPTGDIYCYSHGDTPTRTHFGRNCFTCVNVDLKAPYTAFTRRRRHQQGEASVKCEAAAAIAPYMATVNDLSQPLTKTSAHTLKVVYEITN